MIIFTVTNTLTHQVYVGSTRNDLEDQWEKMVTAAEQDLDYPLYRDIRKYGTDIFHREVYDMADNRSELAELEQNAVEELDAISLRGHKTSTVIIKKKPPVRRKASDAEKELLDLLDSFATDELLDELPEESPTRKTDATPSANSPAGSTISAANSAGANVTSASQSQAAIPDPVMGDNKPAPRKPAIKVGKFDALAAAKAIIAQAAQEEEAKAAAAEAEAKAEAERSKRASRTTGNVSIDLNLDDAINAQLAAITAAVDSVLAGDTSAANSLENLSIQAPEAPQAINTATVIQDNTVEAHAANHAPERAEDVAAESAMEASVIDQPAPVVSERDQRIMDAIARQRSLRAQRSGAVIETEMAELKALLEELNQRVAAMPVANTFQI